MNAVRSGVSAACVLLPGESVEDRRAHIENWNVTFHPSTPGEAWLGAKIADCMVRLDRVDSLVRAAEEAGVEDVLKKTCAFERFSTSRDAVEGLRALAAMAEGVAVTVEGTDVSQVAPAMRRVLELVEAADIPTSALVALRDAMNAVVVDCVLGVTADAFHELGRAARVTEAVLAPIVERVGRELDAERARLVQDPTLADESMLRRLDRYRGRITRELEGLLRLLREVRALAAPSDGGSGSFVQVELRVVGRTNLAQP